MTTALHILALATALAAAATPAFAWSEPDCSHYEETGRNICAVGAKMSGGRNGHEQAVVIGITQDQSGETYANVLIIDEAWSMPERNGLSASVSVDGTAPVRAEARTANHSVVLFLPIKALPVLQAANTLHIKLPIFAESYSLKGSRRAIDALAAAFAAFTRPSSKVQAPDPFAGSDPFVGAAPEAPPSRDPFTPVRRRST